MDKFEICEAAVQWTDATVWFLGKEQAMHLTLHIANQARERDDKLTEAKATIALALIQLSK